MSLRCPVRSALLVIGLTGRELVVLLVVVDLFSVGYSSNRVGLPLLVGNFLHTKMLVSCLQLLIVSWWRLSSVPISS